MFPGQELKSLVHFSSKTCAATQMGVSHTTSECIDKQSAPVATSCITLTATRMYQLLKDLLSIFRCKWRACYPAYFFPSLLGDGMPTRGHFTKVIATNFTKYQQSSIVWVLPTLNLPLYLLHIRTWGLLKLETCF